MTTEKTEVQETSIERRDPSEKFQRTELTEFRSVGKGRTFEFPFSSEYPVERYFRDTPLMIIGEGTSEIQKMVIARKLLDRYSVE